MQATLSPAAALSGTQFDGLLGSTMASSPAKSARLAELQQFYDDDMVVMMSALHEMIEMMGKGRGLSRAQNHLRVARRTLHYTWTFATCWQEILTDPITDVEASIDLMRFDHKLTDDLPNLPSRKSIDEYTNKMIAMREYIKRMNEAAMPFPKCLRGPSKAPNLSGAPDFLNAFYMIRHAYNSLSILEQRMNMMSWSEAREFLKVEEHIHAGVKLDYHRAKILVKRGQGALFALFVSRVDDVGTQADWVRTFQTFLDELAGRW